MPMEHVFIDCQLGIQEQPQSPGDYQMIVMEPGAAAVYRFPMNEKGLEAIYEEAGKLLHKPKLHVASSMPSANGGS